MTTETTQALGLVTTKQTGELAISASAAHAKALVEAKFIMAAHRPRNIMQARDTILAACRRPGFAASAWYAKPVGSGKVRGPSIRFAEMAIQAMTNITVIPSIIHEDDDKRVMFIEVIDLETNTSYGDSVTISKTVERKDSKGREVVAERLNSFGEKVYIVRATEDEIANKANAAKSKIIRNSGLRLVPQDLIEEAEAEVRTTRDQGGNDDRATSIKRMADAFSDMGVKPADLERYLGHPLAGVSPSELSDLREIFATIRDGEAKWADYMDGKGGNEAKSASKSPLFKTSTVEAPAKPDPAPQEAQLIDTPAVSLPEQLRERLKAEKLQFAKVVSVLIAGGILKEEVASVDELTDDQLRDTLSAWPQVVAQVKGKGGNA